MLLNSFKYKAILVYGCPKFNFIRHLERSEGCPNTAQSHSQELPHCVRDDDDALRTAVYFSEIFIPSLAFLS